MWGWVDKLKSFINTITNKLLGRTEMRAVSAAAEQVHANVTATLASQLADNTINLAQWQTAMREEIKNAYMQQYMLGRGGAEQLTQVDYGSIGGMLRDQYRYLDDFAAEIAQGNLSEAQIAQRSQMYISSANEGFNRGRVRAYGVPMEKLPAIPGDGSSCDGKTNCKCNWEIEAVTEGDKFTGWNCTWTLGQADHCDQCLDHAATWKPLFIAAEGE